MSNEEANSSRNDEFHLPTIPSDDWEMNVFLIKLAGELTGEDLKTMKYLLTGRNGSGKGVLELIKDPLDLFEHLRQRRILTRDNIVVLQAMLWHSRRKDLHNKFVKFAKKREHIVHFFAPNDKPENGYEYIKFHIGGREKMDRHRLEELRMHVSHALCIPLEFVIASGIEATTSIMVPFMVPKGYANLFSDLANKDKEYLGSKDAIWYNGQLINCIEEGVVTILVEIKRINLHGDWVTQSNLRIKAYTGEDEDIEHEEGAAGPGTLDSETPSKMTTNSGFNGKEKHIKQKQAAPIASPTTLEAMNERLQRIEVMVERNVKMTERFTSGIPEQKCFPGKSVSGNQYDLSKLFDRSLLTKVSCVNQSNLRIKAYTGEDEDIEHEEDAAGPGTLDSETPSKMTTNSGFNGKEKHIKQKQAAPIASPTTLEAMNERLQRIEVMVERNVKMTERFTSGIPEQKCFLGKSVSGNQYDLSKLFDSSLLTKV